MEIELIANIYGPLSEESKSWPYLLRIGDSLHLMKYDDLMKLLSLLDEFRNNTRIERF